MHEHVRLALHHVDFLDGRVEVLVEELRVAARRQLKLGFLWHCFLYFLFGQLDFDLGLINRAIYGL